MYKAFKAFPADVRVRAFHRFTNAERLNPFSPFRVCVFGGRRMAQSMCPIGACLLEVDEDLPSCPGARFFEDKDLGVRAADAGRFMEWWDNEVIHNPEDPEEVDALAVAMGVMTRRRGEA